MENNIEKEILNYLTDNFPKDYSIEELSKTLNYNRKTISTYLKVLEAKEDVLFTRKIGNAKMYSKNHLNSA